MHAKAILIVEGQRPDDPRQVPSNGTHSQRYLVEVPASPIPQKDDGVPGPLWEAAVEAIQHHRAFPLTRHPDFDLERWSLDVLRHTARLIITAYPD